MVKVIRFIGPHRTVLTGIMLKIFKFGEFKYGIGLLPGRFWFRRLSGFSISIGLWLIALAKWRWK